MSRNTKATFYLLLTLASSGLAVFLNKVTELFELPALYTIILAVFFLLSAFLLTFKLQAGMDEAGDSAQRAHAAASGHWLTPFCAQRKRLYRAALCGVSGLAGGLVWVAFGFIGCVIGMALMFVLLNVVSKRRSGDAVLLRSVTCMLFGLIIEFLASGLILASGTELYVDQVAVFPLVRTTGGVWVALIGGMQGLMLGMAE